MEEYLKLSTDIVSRWALTKSEITKIMLSDDLPTDKIAKLVKYFLSQNLKSPEQADFMVNMLRTDFFKGVKMADIHTDMKDILNKVENITDMMDSLIKQSEKLNKYLDGIKAVLKDREIEDVDKVYKIELLLI